MQQTKTLINYSPDKKDFESIYIDKFNNHLLTELTKKFGGVRFGEVGGTWCKDATEFKENYFNIFYESGIVIEICSHLNKDNILQMIKTAFKDTKFIFNLTKISWIHIEQSEIETKHFNLNEI